MKLSEYKNEEALDILADILDPVSEIVTDKNVKKAYENGNLLNVAKVIIKNHKKSIIEILARFDNIPVEEYNCNIFSLPKKIVEILNDSDLLNFFSSSADQMEKPVSVDVMEITTETEKI